MATEARTAGIRVDTVKEPGLDPRALRGLRRLLVADDVIANGIAVESIVARTAAAKGRRLLGRLKRPPDTFLVGIVGRLSLVPDHLTLIRTIQRLRGARRPVDLMVVGEGTFRPQLGAEGWHHRLPACGRAALDRPSTDEIVVQLNHDSNTEAGLREKFTPGWAPL